MGKGHGKGSKEDFSACSPCEGTLYTLGLSNRAAKAGLAETHSDADNKYLNGGKGIVKPKMQASSADQVVGSESTPLREGAGPGAETSEGRKKLGKCCTWPYASEFVFMYPVASALCSTFRSIGFTPNTISLLGLGFSFGTAYTVATNHFYVGMVLMAIHQMLDAMDGTMARRYNMCSPFGAKLDEVCDQITGVLITVGALYVSWDTTYLFAFWVGISVFMLCGSISYGNRDNTKVYIDELTCMEWFGLFLEENMSYVMAVLFAIGTMGLAA